MGNCTPRPDVDAGGGCTGDKRGSHPSPSEVRPRPALAAPENSRSYFAFSSICTSTSPICVVPHAFMPGDMMSPVR